EGEARRSNLSLDCFGLKPSQPSGLLRHGVYTERSECVPRNDTKKDCFTKIARNDTLCSLAMIHAFVLLVFISLTGCQNRQLYKDNRVLMGTFVEVVSPDARAGEIVFGEIKRIEGLLSKYGPQSEVSKLNALGELKVSPETFYIIKKSKEFSQASAGAFDITVAPLVGLWGFTDKKFRVPSEEEIKNILPLVGADKIVLQEDDSVVKFILSRMKIDLGAIAKGFALDCAAQKLKAAGIDSCLVNAGGQILAIGKKFQRPWVVAIKAPRSRGIAGKLELVDKSISTSGDYQQYFQKGSKRYAHILDPKTGYPADSGVISVTVVAPDGLTADALSTAIFVLGEAKGRELAKKFAGVKVEITHAQYR
ncbi:MAG: FAD:protein FMN transferase, partial [Candidatus Omnitrophota bacterium]